MKLSAILLETFASAALHAVFWLSLVVWFARWGTFGPEAQLAAAELVMLLQEVTQ